MDSGYEKRRLKRIVYASSLTTHLGLPELHHIAADTPARPRDLYALTKLFGEQLAEQYSRFYGIPTVCLRLGQPMLEDFKPMLQLLRGIRTRGLVVHLEDIAEAVRCALSSGSDCHTVVNVVSHSDSPLVSMSTADVIGYRPRYVVSADGLRLVDGYEPPRRRRLRIAAVVTEYRENSHADVILSRWLEPRPGDAAWGWAAPRTDITAIYADQLPENDMAVAVCQKHGVQLCDSVRAALVDDAGQLAVDGVLLIAEHGDYPRNDLGQILYPRKDLFDQIAAVFQDCGRSAPVFCDKHYSWNIEWAKAMTATACDLNFMLTGGSAIPHCRLEPPLELPPGSFPKHVVAVFYGDEEAYGFHSIELAQSIIEKRPCGEVGIRSVTVWKGNDVWEELARGRWPADLMDAAISVITDKSAGVENAVLAGDIQANVDAHEQQVSAFQLEYLDGVHVTHINLTGHISSWGIALRMPGSDTILATTPVMGGADSHYAHFATLNGVVEEAFTSGAPPHPPQRTWLTTGAIAAMMRARQTPGVAVATPDLWIGYQGGPCDGFRPQTEHDAIALRQTKEASE